MVYNLILRKFKDDNEPIIVYANVDNVPGVEYQVEYFCGYHDHISIDTYRQLTKPATLQECQNLLNTLIFNYKIGNDYKIVKRLKINKRG